MAGVIVQCPCCGSQFRRHMDCVNAIKRAEEAESRSAKAALEIAELKRELRLLTPVVSQELAVIEARAR